MNNLLNLKKHYDSKGWVIIKNLLSIEEINKVNSVINKFLLKKVKSINKIDRSINFTGNSKNLNSLNSFHELATCKEIKDYAKNVNILNIVKYFLNSEPEFKCCELFAKPA